MGNVPSRTIVVGVLAGFLLLQPDPDGAHAAVPAPGALLLQEAAADTTELPAADSLPRDTTAADTISREGLEPVVRIAAGLSILSGSVVGESSGRPVSAAVATLKRVNRPDSDGLRTETDRHGRFRFEGVPSGAYHLHIHHIGYRDRNDTVSVGHRDLVTLDVPMTTQAVELPELEVNVRSAWLARTGFYWRKERGLGQFVSPEQVQARSAQSFGQLLRGVPGVRVVRVCDSYPCETLIRMRHTNVARSCKVQFFMDGQRMSGTVYANDISAHDIAAIEIYRNIAETPAQFYGRCGSVVMWSKRYDPTSSR